MNTEEIKSVGFIFTLIVLVGLLLNQNYQINKLADKSHQAMKVALEVNSDLQQVKGDSKQNESKLSSEIDLLKEEIDELNKFKDMKLFKDLLTVKPEMRFKTLMTCKTESDFNYNVIHRGIYDATTTGVCGIKTHWINIIPEITKDNINSLYAGSLVIEYLLNKNNGNLYAAMKEFKGSIRNTAPVDKVMALISRHKNIEKIVQNM